MQCLIRYETCRSKKPTNSVQQRKVSESESEFKEDSDIEYGDREGDTNEGVQARSTRSVVRLQTNNEES